MDFQELISYTQELEVENKQLKKHIFNIQQQLNQKNQNILLLTQKRQELGEHIKKCENQIIKRQQRQIALISNIESLTKQVGIYIDQITRLKQSTNVLKEDGDNANKAGIKSMKLPPKSNPKCKNCQLLAMDKDGLFIQLQKQRQKCYMLQRDVECLVGTFCNQ